jgi:hypothetical protein
MRHVQKVKSAPTQLHLEQAAIGYFIFHINISHAAARGAAVHHQPPGGLLVPTKCPNPNPNRNRTTHHAPCRTTHHAPRTTHHAPPPPPPRTTHHTPHRTPHTVHRAQRAAAHSARRAQTTHYAAMSRRTTWCRYRVSRKKHGPPTTEGHKARKPKKPE